jgi:hypothetical protein
MSRRSGQSGSVERKGDQYVVRFWEDKAGQEKRVHRSVRICPVSGPGSMTKPERKHRAREIILESGADTAGHFRQVEAVNLGTTFRQQSERKRPSNAPVRGVESVLKCRHGQRTAGGGTEATDASRGSAVSGGVCEQQYAAERVLPESRFELQHAGSPSEEAAVEEEKRSRRRSVGARGIGHQETADGAPSELRVSRCVVGRAPDRSAGRF